MGSISGTKSWRTPREGKISKGTDVFLFKYQGLFYVAPAQDSFMFAAAIPGGIVNSHQVRGLADLAQDCAGGYVDVTTRANLQFREIGPRYNRAPFDGPGRGFLGIHGNPRSQGADEFCGNVQSAGVDR